MTTYARDLICRMVSEVMLGLKDKDTVKHMREAGPSSTILTGGTFGEVLATADTIEKRANASIDRGIVAFVDLLNLVQNTETKTIRRSEIPTMAELPNMRNVYRGRWNACFLYRITDSWYNKPAGWYWSNDEWGATLHHVVIIEDLPASTSRESSQ